MTAVIDSVSEFRAGSRQEDDITLLLVKLIPMPTGG
jgi:serine phosphatase RsbU (regulator of sigma subunit)